MRNVLKWLLIVGAIAALVFGYMKYQQQQAVETPPEILRSTKLERGILESTVNASGNITTDNRTELLIETPGKITEVNVTVGDRVVEGQTLATLSTDDLERSLRQAEIGLELAELALETEQESADPEEIRLAELAVNSAAESLELARLGTQTAQVDANDKIVQAQRNREQAYITLRDAAADRAEDAQTAYAQAEAEEKAMHVNAEVTIAQAESQYQSAYTAYQRALVNLETLRKDPDNEKIRQQELQVEQARLRRDQLERRLQDSKIIAPHNGLIASVQIEVGAYQNAGQPAFTLIDDSTFYVDVVIDEIDISAVAIGQDVIVVLDAYPDQPLSGVVETIAPSPTDLSGLVAYQVQVKLYNNTDLRILEAMTASVTIITAQREDVLLLPTWAIRVDDKTNETYTYVVTNGLPSRTLVELGEQSEGYAEVLSGVQEGATVALVLEERKFTPPGAAREELPFN